MENKIKRNTKMINAKLDFVACEVMTSEVMNGVMMDNGFNIGELMWFNEHGKREYVGSNDPAIGHILTIGGGRTLFTNEPGTEFRMTINTVLKSASNPFDVGYFEIKFDIFDLESGTYENKYANSWMWDDVVDMQKEKIVGDIVEDMVNESSKSLDYHANLFGKEVK